MHNKTGLLCLIEISDRFMVTFWPIGSATPGSTPGSLSPLFYQEGRVYGNEEGLEMGATKIRGLLPVFNQQYFLQTRPGDLA